MPDIAASFSLAAPAFSVALAKRVPADRTGPLAQLLPVASPPSRAHSWRGARQPPCHGVAAGWTAFSRYRCTVSRMRPAWAKMSLTSSTGTRSSDLFASTSPSRF